MYLESRLDFGMDLLSYILINSKNTFFELLGVITAKGQRSDFYVISRIWAKLSTVLKSTIFVLEKFFLHQKNQNGHIRWGGDGQKCHLINKFRDIVDQIIAKNHKNLLFSPKYCTYILIKFFTKILVATDSIMYSIAFWYF